MHRPIRITRFTLVIKDSADIDESSGHLLLDIDNTMQPGGKLTVASTDGEIRYVLGTIGGYTDHDEKCARVFADTGEQRVRFVFTRTPGGQKDDEYHVEFTIGEDSETWVNGLLQIFGNESFLRIDLGDLIEDQA